MALSIKCDSLALRTESREERILVLLLLLFFFLSLEVWVAMPFTAQKRGCLKCKIHAPAEH